VLVVDNEPDARGLVSAILESRGAEVTAVESAEDAIREIRRKRPDVLLSDIAMPGEDGYALIRRIRLLESPAPPLPAAALTAFATSGDRAEALDAGYQAHLAKPIEPSELTAVVAALARPNRPQELTGAREVRGVQLDRCHGRTRSTLESRNRSPEPSS
jgi:CheY-like chemotaxis protein